MNENLVGVPELQSDASLVESSLAGDREAFGQIVARYQSPICALAYSACGNVARSEDLAQEILITAWRKLGSLQEPAKFKGWLYGIARNLIHNAFRRQQRNPMADAEVLGDAGEPVSPVHEPDEQAISKEEETILWHVLSGMPEIYREPMVLFYRQNESIQQVAGVLEISEEAVRQRLSRGRALLNAGVTQVIQNGLRRSRTTDTFTVAVIAALPALAAATTAKGAVIGMAATKGASGQATGLIGFLKSIACFAGLVALPATLGTYFGFKLGQDATGLPQRRKSAAKFWRVFGGGLVLLLLFPLLLTFGVTGFLKGDTRALFLSIMTVWLGLAYPFVPGALLYWAWQRRRTPTTTEPGPALSPSESAPQPVGQILAGVPRRISRRLVLFLTIAAASLLVFCYLDMHHNVGRLSSAKVQDLINQSAPGDLRVSISVSHNRSVWGESPEMYRYFFVELRPAGKPASYYLAPVDEATVALLAQKGITCPVYLAGRDFEVLGAAGRFLPFLAAFVLAIGVVFLLKRPRAVSPAMR